VSTVVVGVDGSEGSVEALRFALEEARIRGADLKAVNAWHIPPAVYGAGWAPASVDLDEYRKLAESALEKSLEDAGAAGSGVTVTSVLQEGQPADVLCAEAETADLLVVGSRGLGGFRGLLLGSVSQQCAHHARCPVVVVPARHPPG
jgi:nucleotide-binding universal stress UspA family protein